MDAPVTTRPEKQDVQLKELLDMLRRGRLFIAAFTVAVAGLAAAAAFLTPKSYQAVVLLAPVSSTPGEGSMSPLGALASQFGGLASLAGVSLSTDSKRSESIAFLQSDALTSKYIQDNELLPVIYRSEWDAASKRWKVSRPPTLWEATNRFKGSIRTVTTDSKTGLVTLKINWRDPTLAAKWANDLVKMTNDYLRDRAIEQADRDIAYLNSQAEKTNIVEARQAIFMVLQNELTKAMLARGTKEYAFKVIDPAVAPEKPASPRPKLWIAVGLFAGLLVSSFLVIFRAAML